MEPGLLGHEDLRIAGLFGVVNRVHLLNFPWGFKGTSLHPSVLKRTFSRDFALVSEERDTSITARFETLQFDRIKRSQSANSGSWQQDS
jgi:hypothetical protein